MQKSAPQSLLAHMLVPHRVPGRAMSNLIWSTGAIEFDASRCKMRCFDGRDSTALAPTARLTQAPLLLRPSGCNLAKRRLELDIDTLDDTCCFEIHQEPVGAGDGRALHVFCRLPSILQPVAFESVRDHGRRAQITSHRSRSLVYSAISISSAGAASAAASGRCSAPTAFCGGAHS